MFKVLVAAVTGHLQNNYADFPLGLLLLLAEAEIVESLNLGLNLFMASQFAECVICLAFFFFFFCKHVSGSEKSAVWIVFVIVS